MNLFIQSGMDIFVTHVVQGHVPKPPGDGWTVVGVLATPDVDTGITMSQLSFIWTRSHVHAEHEAGAPASKDGAKEGGKKKSRLSEPNPRLYADPVVRERDEAAVKKVYDFACPTCGAKIGELCRDKPCEENPEMSIRSNGHIHTKRLGAMNDAKKAAGKPFEDA